MSRNHLAKEFLVGAAVGTLLGGVAALMSAPASGQKTRKQLKNLYCDMEERAEDLVEGISRKGKSIAKSVNCSADDWVGKARCLASRLSGECDEDSECGTKDLLIGSAIGGIVGAVAGLLLAPKPGSELREDLAERYEDVSEKAHDFVDDVQRKSKGFAKKARKQTNKWLDLAHSMADEFVDDAEEASEEFVDKAKNRLDDVMEWATLGYRVWQGLNKRR
jgi:gas vesicle protein